MKTTDPRDPLDQQIDALLKSRPLQPSEDFTSRVLAACEQESATTVGAANQRSNILRFALPLAAAIAIALVSVSLLQQESSQSSSPTQLANTDTPTPAEASTTALPSIEEIDAQEIFLIEDRLSSSLALTDETADLGNGELLATFDALLYDIRS
ncbi:MAG: hypothetical protein ACPGJU_09215 [Coraliomargarita sp.]